MAELVRSEVVALLERLGDENDETVLQAARSLNTHVRESGMTWDQLLYPEGGAAEPLDPPGTDPVLEDDLDEDDTDGETPAGLPVTADKADDAKVIERLLAKKGLSKEMRDSLRELRRGLGDGSFDAGDSRYVRALAKRLGA